MNARMAIAGAVVATSLFASHSASATPRWVDRLLTLPGPVAGTINLDGAVAHADEPCVGAPGTCGYNGFGSSIEGVLGLASRVDIGLGVGIRGFNDANTNEGVMANADAYARMFDQLAFYGNGAQQSIWGNDAITNPQLKVRVRILNVKRVFELGVEVRHNLPFLRGTVFDVVAGVPMALHAGHHVRFDFGGYTGFTFYDRATFGTSFSFYAPGALWFQIDRVYLGPLFGFRWYDHDVYPGANPGDRNWDFMLGFGLGVSLTHYLDFQLQSYLPRVNAFEEKQFGVGAGVQFYFGRREGYYR